MIGTDLSEDREIPRTERGSKRIRAYLGGRLVFDTCRPLLVWEVAGYPAYYVPREDVFARLEEADEPSDSAGLHDVRVIGHVAPGAAVVHEGTSVEMLRGHVRFAWDAMDVWFEEDEEIFFHPRDPYTRIDALRSSRHVVVELDGEVLADSSSPVILYETGRAPRHYLPGTDVRRELLVASDRVTHCPYKGSTRYYHVRVGGREEPDVAWSYPAPLAEALPIGGLICFAAERVDLIVDGVRQERT